MTPTCYKVESSRAGAFYLVDLVANNGAGSCTCADYLSRRGPAYKAGKPAFTKDTSCKHLLTARQTYLEAELVRLSQLGQRVESNLSKPQPPLLYHSIPKR